MGLTFIAFICGNNGTMLLVMLFHCPGPIAPYPLEGVLQNHTVLHPMHAPKRFLAVMGAR